MMQLFADTAVIEEIKEAASWRIIDGVTTNPTLIARAGLSLTEAIQTIVDLIDGPISAEVAEGSWDAMVTEAKEYAAMHPNIVIKIPMTSEGVKAIRALDEQGIRTNCTLVFTVSQALLAAKAGADFISPFLGRLDDRTERHDAGYVLVRDMREMLDTYGFPSKIIAASIRHRTHVEQAMRAGAHIATVPFKVLKELFLHPLTDDGLKRFAADAKKG